MFGLGDVECDDNIEILARIKSAAVAPKTPALLALHVNSLTIPEQGSDAEQERKSLPVP